MLSIKFLRVSLWHMSITIRDIVGGQSMQIFSEINSILFSKAEDFYGKKELLRGFLRENRI